MRRLWFSQNAITIALLMLIAVVAAAAQTHSLSSSDKLAAAKNAFLRKDRGSDIPYEVISSSIEGWGHFVLVDAPEKADIVIEVSSSEGGGVTATSSSKTSPQTGRPEYAAGTSKDLSSSEVKLIVYDPRDKNKLPLWSATEKAKFAMKQKARENNLLEAAQRLFLKFHDRVEPPGSQ